MALTVACFHERRGRLPLLPSTINLLPLHNMSLLNSIISFAVALHPATDNDCKTAATTDVASIASSSSSESDYETCSESEEEEEGESASIGILPPELVRQVLGQAALDRYEWFVVEGQLERIETQCRVSHSTFYSRGSQH